MVFFVFSLSSFGYFICLHNGLIAHYPDFVLGSRQGKNHMMAGWTLTFQKCWTIPLRTDPPQKHIFLTQTHIHMSASSLSFGHLISFLRGFGSFFPLRASSGNQFRPKALPMPGWKIRTAIVLSASRSFNLREFTKPTHLATITIMTTQGVGVLRCSHSATASVLSNEF